MTRAVNHRHNDAGSQRESPVLHTANVTERCRLTSDTLSRLLALGMLIERNLTRQLRPWRITLGEYQLLNAFGGHERRQVEIANELQRSRVTVCRQVKNLIELGCLHKEIDIADQRAKWLSVTPFGMYLRREAYRALSEMVRDLSQSLDPELMPMFEKLINNADALVRQPQYRQDRRAQ